MKKSLLKVLTAVVAVAVIGASCGKDDTGAPAITLNGEKSVYVDLGGSYTDQGATATDEEDGDLTSQITVSGTVDYTKVGAYELTYSVSDKAGNSTEETRTVYVKADKLAGTYNVHAIISGAVPDTIDWTETITASSAAYNKLIVSGFLGYDNCTATLTVNSNGFNADGDYTFSTTAGNVHITLTTGATSYDGATFKILSARITCDYNDSTVDINNCTYTKL